MKRGILERGNKDIVKFNLSTANRRVTCSFASLTANKVALSVKKIMLHGKLDNVNVNELSRSRLAKCAPKGEGKRSLMTTRIISRFLYDVSVSALIGK
jgi:hypothetical protein